MTSATLLRSITPLALPFLLFLLPRSTVGDSLDDLWSKYMADTAAQQQTQAFESTVSRRERNLDHWDVPTAAAYLGLHPETLIPLPRYASEGSLNDSTAEESQLTDEYIGHDAAVLFYAQWCRNCHAIAPSWDAIATHLNAGKRSSNLLMALFDCEKDTRHTELCLAAGVAVYPTMMFVGSGEYHDTDIVTSSVLGKDKSAGPFGATKLRRTVKFQGNWQYADSVLDWVSLMRGLSSWHAVTESGPLKGLRNGIFRLITGGKSRKGGRSNGRGGKEGSLPVGVPPNFQTELRGPSSVNSAATVASAAEVKSLELKLNKTTEEKKLYEMAVTHSSYLLDGLLFKKNSTDGASPPRDPFTILTNSDGWYQNATTLPAGSPNDEHPSILRSCTLELTIDYCTRVTTRNTNTYLKELAAIPESDPFPTLAEIEATLMESVKKEEEYCGIIEPCITSNYEGGECRVQQCPFKNEAACDYVGSCFDPEVQNEYGVALKLIEEGKKVLDMDWSGSSGGSDVKGPTAATSSAEEGIAKEGGAAGVGGWGIPVS
mmetsp:Transcript_17419/g.41819  ORF Transcript_17419/g.41819 Transcript_17419/m.41819 type:complete len:545 (-) Transcript_17419:100-1734(-)